MPSFKHFFGNQRITSLKFAGQQTSVKGFIAQVVGWFGHIELSPKLEQSSPCLKLTRVSRVADAAHTEHKQICQQPADDRTRYVDTFRDGFANGVWKRSGLAPFGRFFLVRNWTCVSLSPSLPPLWLAPPWSRAFTMARKALSNILRHPSRRHPTNNRRIQGDERLNSIALPPISSG